MYSCLKDHGIAEPPKSSSTRRWLAWTKVLLDMLELSESGLTLTKPLPEKNGLPKGFSLTGENTLLAEESKDGLSVLPAHADHRPQTTGSNGSSSSDGGMTNPGLLKKPDRRAVTCFFNCY